MAAEGWVHFRKKSLTTILKNDDWKRRFLRLRGTSLTWCHDARIEDAYLAVSIDLRSQLVRYESKSQFLGKTYQMGVKTPSGSYVVAFNSEHLREQWLAMIFGVLETLYDIQESRIAFQKDIVAGLEISFDSTPHHEYLAARDLLQALEEKSRPRPFISDETDSRVEKLARVANKLAKADDETTISFVETGGLETLCNTLERIWRQEWIPEDEVPVLHNILRCFRAIMNKPVGIETMAQDSEPLQLLAKIVFMSSSAPPPQLLQEVSEVLAALAIFSTDGCNAVVRMLRTMDRRFHRTLQRNEQTLGEYTSFEEVEGLTPFAAMVAILGDDTIAPYAILAVCGLLNVIVSIPPTRHERLRLRMECDIAGMNDVLDTLQDYAEAMLMDTRDGPVTVKYRVDRRTREDMLDEMPDREMDGKTLEEVAGGKKKGMFSSNKSNLEVSANSMEYLIARRMSSQPPTGGGGGGSGGGLSSISEDKEMEGEDGEVVSGDVHARTRLQRIKSSIHRSFSNTTPEVALDYQSPGLEGLAGKQKKETEESLITLRRQRKYNDYMLSDELKEAWRQIAEQIHTFRDMGIEEEEEDNTLFEDENMTHVMFRLDRLSLSKRAEIRSQAILIMKEVLTTVEECDPDTISLEVEAFSIKPGKFAAAMQSAKFNNYSEQYRMGGEQMPMHLLTQATSMVSHGGGINPTSVARRQFGSDLDSEDKPMLDTNLMPQKRQGTTASLVTTALLAAREERGYESEEEEDVVVKDEKKQGVMNRMKHGKREDPLAKVVTDQGVKAPPKKNKYPPATQGKKKGNLPPAPGKKASMPPLPPAPGIKKGGPPPPPMPMKGGPPAPPPMPMKGGPPLPPPMPGGKGGPPPPPLPGGKGGPPPPPMPGGKMTGVTGAVRHGMDYDGPIPTEKMRALHWDKIPPMMASNTWWSSEEKGEDDENFFSSQPKSGLPVKEFKLSTKDCDLIQQLFAQAKKKQKGFDAQDEERKEAKKEPEDVKVQLLQGPRAQNIEITLSRLKMSGSEVTEALRTCDVSNLSEQQIELLPLILPDTEEERALKMYTEHGGPLDRLRMSEAFLAEVIQLKRLRNKISVCVAQLGMPKKIQDGNKVLILIICYHNFYFLCCCF